ncbi:MAG TPA: mechanosensitive ion channel family protein [Solirubrobacteraceae bacterium]|jgi:small-conductance mechanosensitive channel|nr:mechanosensitive ion channel family protein [Solirubrobacteraceae bacterium]
MPERNPSSRMFDTRSQSWADVGLLRQLSARAVKRARLRAVVLIPLFIGFVIVFHDRKRILGLSQRTYDDTLTPCRIGAVIVLVILGWAIARNAGHALRPSLFRRMDPATAGTVGFLIRVVTVIIVFIIALNIAGLDPRTLAIGGSITAVVLGLAAQQTLGNLFAGTVLLSARPFKVGERVRFQGGSISGPIEGVVSSLGLLYTTLASGDDSILIPNSVVLNIAVMPLREPDAVSLRATVPADVTPAELQATLEDSLVTPLRTRPNITLEELDGDDLVLLIQATPQIAADGPRLAEELISAVSLQGRGRAQLDGSPSKP